MNLKTEIEIQKEISLDVLKEFHKSKIAEYKYLIKKHKNLMEIHKEKLKEIK
jgi:hypothetical protein